VPNPGQRLKPLTCPQRPGDSCISFPNTNEEASMNTRAVCEGSFTLPLPLADAVALFTPEGERSWAGRHWDPVYAIPPAPGEDAAPGTVFTTESTGGDATWIVLERREDGMKYARVVPGRLAGTVDVRCSRNAGSGDGTHVSVCYDVTSLGPAGALFVEELEKGYEAFLADWRREILAACSS
jgi:hypothetical protein